ncbi:tRNA adenosine(34) deaminase TadA [Succinivibrio dextrinosolvens]|uniref:tRNA adenosine(34) deaminase TadA n=1 Tax=Succinivibrio dextrinosolvens TaxID=83771 RepID=UPI0004E1B88A|nr:tRNA adenosine(34) deaminase TadA [Succinivibrio dextrinosolvens]
MQNTPEDLMRLAIEMAKEAYKIGEVPVGCVIADEEGNVISTGYNRSITDNDPSAHAEMVAIRNAGEVLKNYRMPGLSLYVTLEPCCMCSGAIIHARFSKVYYGASDLKTGACGSVFDVISDPRHNHRVECIGGVLADECSKMLSDFFKERRLQKKNEALKS